MRAARWVGGLAAAGAAGFLLRAAWPPGGEAAPIPLAADPPASAAPGPVAGPDDDWRRRLDRLEAAVDRLERAIATRDVGTGPAADRPTAPLDGPARSAAGSGAPVRAMPAGTPGELLDAWIRSFAGGGTGSEWFRLAVEAHAAVLSADLARLAADPSADATLRAAAIPMLGALATRGDGAAVEALLAAVRAGGPGDVWGAALDALQATGNPRLGPALESALRAAPDDAIRQRGYPIVVALTEPAEVNRTLLRLYGDATPAVLRDAVLAGMNAEDPGAGGEILLRAWAGETETRVAAASRLGMLRGPDVRRWIESRLAGEGEAAVRAALEAARTAQDTIPSWHPGKLVGPPDAFPNTSDHVNAWAARTQDGGVEWLELDYDAPRRATAVRVHEVCVAGAVTAVAVRDPGGAWHEVWRGVDPTTVPGPFEVRFAPTAFVVHGVRVTLDTARRTGWEEVDAVELLGPDGTSVASGARASSTYAEHAAAPIPKFRMRGFGG